MNTEDFKNNLNSQESVDIIKALSEIVNVDVDTAKEYLLTAIKLFEINNNK